MEDETKGPGISEGSHAATRNSPWQTFAHVALGLGGLMFGVGVFTFAATHLPVEKKPPPRVEATPTPIEKTPAPNFKLIQLGTFRRDQFLLDSHSGRVWQSVCRGTVNGADCEGGVYWSEMYVDGVTDEASITAWVHRQSLVSLLNTPTPTPKTPKTR